MKKIICLALIVMLSAGCMAKEGNENEKQKESNKPAVTEGEQQSEKAYILTDKLSLRESSDPASDVIAALDMGTEVEIMEKSDSKQRIGEDEAYWYKIKAGDKTGWCYGAFLAGEADLEEKAKKSLERYFASDELTVQQAIKMLTAFAKIVEDTALVDEGVKAIRVLQQEELTGEYSKMLGEAVDISVIWQYNEKELNDVEKLKEAPLKEVVSLIHKNGYHIYSSEGEIYTVPDPQYLLEKFEAYMSEQFKEFMALEAVEIKQRLSSDGGLVVSWDELSDRIANWESYIGKYPDTEEAQKAEEHYYLRYLSFYIHGIDNTPAFDINTLELKDEVKASYERYMEKYPDSKACEAVKAYYDILEKNNFMLNDEVTEYLTQLLMS